METTLNTCLECIKAYQTAEDKIPEEFVSIELIAAKAGVSTSEALAAIDSCDKAQVEKQLFTVERSGKMQQVLHVKATAAKTEAVKTKG